MTPSSPIPQHPLQDDSGRPVDFHFAPWGKKTENYDFEKPHRHQFYEILFFLKGGGVHDIDFTTYKAKPRAVHFVAPDNVHLVLRNKNTLGCSLQFESHFIENSLLADLPFSSNQPVFTLPQEVFRSVEKILHDLEAEYKSKAADAGEMIRTQFKLLLLHLNRFRQAGAPEIKTQTKYPESLQHFFQLIQDSKAGHQNVRFYADKLNLTDKHLIEMCKNFTGLTPLKHIRQRVVSEAKKLLYHSSLSIKEIAWELGFDDQANFTRYFKSVSGYTPQEYREGIR